MSIIDITVQPLDALHWRLWRADKARLDKPNRAAPVWVAKELVYWCTESNPRNAYYVLLQLPLVGDVVAVSPARADRVVRLLYSWAAIEPHLHIAPTQLTGTVLRDLCTEANILRAGIAYAAKFGKP